MTCPHTHKDDPENAVCEDCKKTELKTLKDLEKYLPDEVEDGCFPLILEKELKAEAAKWVKAMNERGMEREFNDLYHWYDYDAGDIPGFIKHFFNLTEDDLK